MSDCFVFYSHELNLSVQQSGFTIYRKYKPAPEDMDRVKVGDIIRFYHKEMEAYLVAEGLFDDELLEDGKATSLLYLLSVCTSFRLTGCLSMILLFNVNENLKLYVNMNIGGVYFSFDWQNLVLDLFTDVGRLNALRICTTDKTQSFCFQYI